MGILPSLRSTLNLLAFMGNLIDLKQFDTILVLYDQTTRNQINMLIETISPSYNVAWMLVNEYDKLEYWNHSIIQHQNHLILTALNNKNIYPILTRLYENKNLKKRSKNLIVSSSFSKSANEILSSLLGKQINAVLVDWTLAEVLIYAWNPYSERKFIQLNESEFLRASNAADATRGKYAGLFFDQLQGMQGRSLDAMFIYDPTKVYNVVSKDLIATVDGTEIQIVNLIGVAMQSKLNLLVIKYFGYDHRVEFNLFKDFLERTYKTYAPIQQRSVNILTLDDALR